MLEEIYCGCMGKANELVPCVSQDGDMRGEVGGLDEFVVGKEFLDWGIISCDNGIRTDCEDC